MSLFKSLTKAVVGVVTLPVSAVADVVTLGGVISDKPRTYTGEAASRILDNINEATTPTPKSEVRG